MRQRKNRSKPLQSRQVTEQELLGYPRAIEALEKLKRAGVERNELIRLLCELPSAPDAKQTLAPGISDKSLSALPKRIRSWADEIERVNSSVYLSPKHIPSVARAVSKPDAFREPLNSIFTPEQAERTAVNFQRLPNILRLYADWLREWLPSFKFLGRHGIRPQTLLILRLIKRVRDSCGSPYHGEVATLIEAAFAAAGKPKSIGGDDLSKLERNNVMLGALLHPELFSLPTSRD